MKAIAINEPLLLAITHELRKAGRHDLATRLLKDLQLLQADYVENLLCPQHAARLRGGDRRRIYEHAENGNLTVYRICCKPFVSRKELKELPRIGHRPQKVKL